MTPEKRQRLRLWSVWLAIGYVVFGFLIAPLLIKAVVLWQLPKKIGRQVELKKIKLNPFTASITVDGFMIREQDGQPFVSWDEIFINANPTALLTHKLVLAAVTVSNAYGHVQANRDGSFNFSDILQKFPNEPTLDKKDTGKPWIVRIHQLHITGSRAAYDDLTRATPFATVVGPIDVTLTDFSTSPDHKDPYAFTAVTEAGEKLVWRGNFYFGPIRSEGEFALENITLAKYAPFYDDFFNFTAHDGRVTVRSHYRVEFTDQLTLAQLSNATVNLHSLRLAERNATNDVMELSDLNVRGIAFDLLAQTVTVDSFAATGGRVAVRKLDDGLPNLTKMFMPATPRVASVPVTNAPAKPWELTLRDFRADDHTGTATGFFGEEQTACRTFHLANLHVITEPLSLSVDEVALHEPSLAVTIPATMTNLLALTSGSTNGVPAKNTKPAAPLPSIHIGTFYLINGQATFTDESLQPHAGMSLTGLAVRVTGLSSDTNGIAEVEVTGRVDNIAPFSVAGRVNPFAPDATTEMQVAFKGIDLLPMGGYSGKYAGYLIRKGKLTLNLKYNIYERELKAENSVVMDQFTFGEKTGSPDAVKLPVKLAAAILKDRNGQIKIDLPIEGRTDDPKFRYWGAVWHVAGSLFTKIFTAPFSMLGSMFGGGGEELSYQTFAPGSTALVADETKKLDVLIKALTERPALNLEITGSIDPVKDVEPTKRGKLLEQLRAARAARQPGNTNMLTEVEYAAYLREAYAAALPRIAPPPQPPPTNFTSNVGNLLAPGTKRQSVRRLTEAKKSAATVPVEEMERQYLPLIELTDADYRQLASSRVASVVTYLKTNGQIADDRLFISTNPNTPVTKDGARTIFGLQ